MESSIFLMFYENQEVHRAMIGSWLKLSNSIHVHTVTQTFTHAKQETFVIGRKLAEQGE